MLLLYFRFVALLGVAYGTSLYEPEDEDASVIAASSTEPKLHIYPPNQNPIVTPAIVPFGLICEGEAEDGEFTNMKWFNPGGEEIRDNVRKNDSMLKLIFPKPSVEDSGNYKCIALLSNTLTLEAEVRVDFYEPIIFEECPKIQNLAVGQEGRIRCRAVANPKPTINWEKDSNPLNFDRITINKFGLTIPSVSKEDGGTYSLEAFVKETGNYLVQKIEVNVLTPPEISDLPEEFVAIEGEEYTIKCGATGSEPLTYTWYDHNLRDLSQVDGYKVEQSLLTISKVARNAGGVYMCKVENPVGVDQATIIIEVQVRPSIVYMENITTDEGKDAVFECLGEGIPKPAMSIRRESSDEEMIDSPEDGIELEVFDDGDYSSLRLKINNVKRSHDGLYVCKASNPAGIAEKTGHLQVQSRPSALTQIVFDKVTPTSITFRFMGPRNTGGMPITHYNMKYRLVDQKDDPVKEVTWEKDTPYILSNLIPRAKYEFSAAAINVVGVGNYKQAIYVMPEETVPEPPIIKTRQETISDYPDRFEIRWDKPNNNGKPILKYKLRYFKVERGLKNWIQIQKAVEVTVDADHLSYIMKGLIPDSYYKIVIRATNEIGSSLPEFVVIKTSKDMFAFK